MSTKSITLLDLINPDNTITFNSIIANTFGLTAAIYISELMILAKNSTDEFFEVNRDLIKERTTIIRSEQKKLDDGLVEVGIINKKSSKGKDLIKFNCDNLCALLTNTNPATLKLAKTIVKKPDKNVYLAQYLKDQIDANLPDELKDWYYRWIDSNIANNGKLSKEQVQLAQETINEISNHDLDKAISILKHGIASGYSNIYWVIRSMNSSYTKKSKSNSLHLIPTSSIINNTNNNFKLNEQEF